MRKSSAHLDQAKQPAWPLTSALCVKRKKAMYLKFTIDGDLEELVKGIWPNATEDELFRDYENVYEWVWLSLPEYNLRLNISREHEWGEKTQVYPIYVSAFELEKDEFINEIPEEIIQIFCKGINSKLEIFSGRYNVEVKENEPIRVL